MQNTKRINELDIADIVSNEMLIPIDDNGQTKSITSTQMAEYIKKRMLFGVSFIGALQYSTRKDLPEGWLRCDGSEYPISAYQDFYDNYLVTNKIPNLDYDNYNIYTSEGIKKYVTPVFSSNIQNGFEISDSNGAINAYTLFNGYAGSGAFIVNNWFNYWIQEKFPSFVLLESYLIKADSNGSTEYPTEWKLLASKDGIEYVELDYQTNQVFNSGEEKIYHLNLEITQTYQYFKIQFISGIVYDGTKGELGKIAFNTKEFDNNGGNCPYFGVNSETGKFRTPCIKSDVAIVQTFTPDNLGSYNKINIDNKVALSSLDYEKGFDISSGFVAIETGMVYFSKINSQGSSYIYVNGIECGSNISNSYSYGESGGGSLIPVKAGDVVTTNGGLRVFKFFPCIKDDGASIKYPLLVCVANIAISANESQYNGFIDGLNGKLNSDLSNINPSIDLIVSRGEKDGWIYEIYKSGYVRQTKRNTNIPTTWTTFPLAIPYKNGNYEAWIQNTGSSSSIYTAKVGDVSKNTATAVYAISNKDNTGFEIITYGKGDSYAILNILSSAEQIIEDYKNLSEIQEELKEKIASINTLIATDVQKYIIKSDYSNDIKYEIYNDYSVVQWGTSNVGFNLLLNFAIPFEDDENYSLVATPIMVNTNTGSNDICYINKQAACITLQVRFSGGAQKSAECMWQAMGLGNKEFINNLINGN